MKRTACLIMLGVLCLTLLAAAPQETMPKPGYDEKGQLLRPDDYREWMFLSAGY